MCLTFPLAMTFFILKKFDMLNNSAFEQKFGSYYLDLNVNDKLALIYNMLFMFRRLLFSAIAILVAQWPILQIFSCVMSNIFMLIYLFIVMPFDTN